MSLVVIGLDGATFDLLKPLADKGIMPNISRIMNSGTYANLKTVMPNLTPAAWSSFSTGCNPGKHGVYDWLKFKGSFKDSKIVDSRDIKEKTFYEILEDQNKKCCIINLPLSYPPKNQCDLIAPFASASDNFAFPKEFREKFDFSGFQNHLSDKAKVRKVELGILEYFKSRQKVIREIFNSKKHDLLFCLFSETDWLQHSYFDELMQMSEYDLEDPRIKIYKHIDEFIGWVLDKEDSDLVIVSDHGFQTLHNFFYINNWLKKEGYLKTASNQNIQIVWGGNNRLMSFITKNILLRKAAQFIFPKVKWLLPINKNAKDRIEENLTEGIDLENTKVLCPSTDLGYLYINDERFGGPVKAKEVQSLKEEIMSKINNLPEFSEVLAKDQVYSGEQTPFAPDIIYKPIDCKVSKRLANRTSSKRIINDHAENGIFLAKGPSFKSLGKIDDLSILDMTPLILNYFGYEKMPSMDGQSPKNIFRAPFKLTSLKKNLKKAISDLRF
jgi:predicted AlkP superfamily phosphohydrolase/phosphomutase